MQAEEEGTIIFPSVELFWWSQRSRKLRCSTMAEQSTPPPLDTREEDEVLPLVGVDAVAGEQKALGTECAGFVLVRSAILRRRSLEELATRPALVWPLEPLAAAVIDFPSITDHTVRDFFF